VPFGPILRVELLLPFFFFFFSFFQAVLASKFAIYLKLGRISINGRGVKNTEKLGNWLGKTSGTNIYNNIF
jgi:hypothetical protein